MRAFILASALVAAAMPSAAAADDVVPLFTGKGPPKGWVVRAWSDVSKIVPDDAAWTVTDGVLKPGKLRGTWFLSEKEYGDFILEFEIKLTEIGNSGIALRAPMKGDPAFDGMELQFADLRYNPNAKENELTGSLYRASAPKKQVYKPAEWNTCKIELKGSKLKATINGELIQDIDLDKFDQKVLRLDNKTEAPALKDRPRKGHIGFQHLSRNNEPIEIRNAKITELPEPPDDKELARMKGTWTIVSVAEDGKVVDDEKGGKVVIDGNTLTFKGPEKSKGPDQKGQLVIDPSKKPKAVTLIIPSEKIAMLGIYELEGDALKFCFLPPVKTVVTGKKGNVTQTKTDEGKRPTGFDAKDCFVFTLKRDKP